MQEAQQIIESQAIQSAKLAYIAGIGMLTPVGVNTAMTVASVQAGISQYAVSDFSNHDGQPIKFASVPPEFFTDMEIEVDKGRNYGEQYDHIIKMAVVAIQEAVSSQDIKNPIPFILAMPEPNEAAYHIPVELLLKNLHKQGLPLIQEKIRTLHTGRAAGIQALELALRFMYEAGEDFVLIGGSDSYLSYPRLNTLDPERLSTPGNLDSFVPGEGAGFLLLTKKPQQALCESGQVIALHSPGLGEESGHILSEESYRGDGLDQAFKQALQHHTGSPIDAIYSSQNGERYWAKEYGVALLRNIKCFQKKYGMEHPADCFGDLGAATAPVLMGLAARQLLQQFVPNSSLVYSSSDSALRGAVKVERMALQ